ncbi:hypothetical protein Taro_018502, partial [Colocasia esculenta]|nr:hypothetical protein [Colocasia esculenta]
TSHVSFSLGAATNCQHFSSLRVRAVFCACPGRFDQNGPRREYGTTPFDAAAVANSKIWQLASSAQIEVTVEALLAKVSRDDQAGESHLRRAWPTCDACSELST